MVKVRVNLFVGLRYAEDLILMAFFGRNASKTEEATPKNSSHEAVSRAKEADLASSSLTLLLTKQALKAI